MSSEPGNSGLPLSDQLEEWMAKNAFKNNYHIQGITDTKMIFDDVRIPLKDGNGNNYSSNKFALEFFKTINLVPVKDIKKQHNLYNAQINEKTIVNLLPVCSRNPLPCAKKHSIWNASIFRW